MDQAVSAYADETFEPAGIEFYPNTGGFLFSKSGKNDCQNKVPIEAGDDETE